jgi:S-adenosylmethionine hydrolase
MLEPGSFALKKSPTERIITLTTDFGLKDPWAGIMKGVILSINPGTRVVDITHLVSPQNVLEGAFILSQACPRFPEGTIHVAVVDPGVGGERNPILIETAGFYLVGPDNGLFTLVIEKEKAKRVIRLTRREYFLEEVSSTFHGRDIFAPVAAHLSLGVDPSSFGEPLKGPPRTIKLPRPIKGEGSVTGEVVYVDTFGNLITNISSRDIVHLKGAGPVEVIIKGMRIEGISKTYSKGAEREGAQGPIALVGSSNLLEIACFRARASEVLGAGVGERVDMRVIKI